MPDVATGEANMAKYLFEGHYTLDGAKGVAREGGSARRAAAAKSIEGLGGKLESFYFAFGNVDVYAVIDMPDAVSMAALSLAINQSGGLTGKIVVLIAPEEMDQAAKRAVEYRPPGR
jgi:uncharacterized protein with GYD domain